MLTKIHLIWLLVKSEGIDPYRYLQYDLWITAIANSLHLC